jgi:hypothetical protein
MEPTDRYRAITGWPCAFLAGLDDVHPGFLVAASRAKDVYRQALFAALASNVIDRAESFLERATGEEATGRTWPDTLADLAATLLRMSPKDIVAAAYPSAPEGFVGALERIGHTPLTTADAYRRLHGLFAHRGHARQVRALRYAGRISDRTLDVVEVLDRTLLHPKVVQRVRSTAEARQINETLRLVQEVNRSATPAAIWKSASDLGECTSLGDWLRRFLLKGDRFPEAPLGGGDEEFVPLGDGPALTDAGNRYSNCLATKVLQVLAGRAYFYEFTAAPGAIVSFHRLNTGAWLMTKVYGHSNFPVRPDLIDRVRAKVATLGGHCLTPAPVHQRFMVADRFFERHEFGFWSDIVDDLDGLTLDEVA